MTREPLVGQIEPATAEQLRPAIPLVRLLAGRWTLAVLAGLLDRDRRYQNLHDALDGISHKVLTETLRRAERDGLVARHLDSDRIETATLYELTDLGRSLDVPLAAMAKWAECNWQAVEAARSRWDRLQRAGGE
jgi:DNA-binding HxlR family transcriptional regulator